MLSDATIIKRNIIITRQRSRQTLSNFAINAGKLSYF